MYSCVRMSSAALTHWSTAYSHCRGTSPAGHINSDSRQQPHTKSAYPTESKEFFTQSLFVMAGHTGMTTQHRMTSSHATRFGDRNLQTWTEKECESEQRKFPPCSVFIPRKGCNSDLPALLNFCESYRIKSNMNQYHPHTNRILDEALGVTFVGEVFLCDVDEGGDAKLGEAVQVGPLAVTHPHRQQRVRVVLQGREGGGRETTTGLTVYLFQNRHQRHSDSR